MALALELSGTSRDFLFEPLIQMAILEQHLAALERALHRPPQIGELDRLGEIIHRAALHAQCRAGRVVDGGEHQDREIGLDLERLGHEIHAALPGHPDIRQHQRHFVEAQLLERFVARRRRIDLELLLLEEFPQRVSDRLFVIDHEHGDDTGMSGQPNAP